ncbi:ABC transporter substrate-binding protein [Jiangella muralis]|uniref:ABC transporter substrate-binding protein n=1 Tax=Jiangella muralis TaxID=702383 RepID=UPI000A46999E|nr:extracellular solute-binding protein [Jiangella muralis]
MNTRRRFLTAGVLAGAVLTASACGGGDDDVAGGEGGDTTLRMIVNITPNLTEQFWNELFDKYEAENPGITVELELTGTIEAEAKLQQDLAAGDPPDIAQHVIPNPETAELFVDLSDEDWAPDTPLYDDYAIDGGHYVVGVGEQIQSLVFYNKAAFEEAGVDATQLQTIAQFEDAMRKLQAAGYQPLQSAGQWVTGAQFTMLADAGVLTEEPDWVIERKNGETSFADSGYLRYFELYESWLKEGFLTQSALGLEYPDGQAAFLAGDSAMYIMGSYFVPAADEAGLSDQIGVFPVPADGTYPPGQFGNMAQPYTVVEASDAKEEAIDLVEWLVTDDEAIEIQLAADGNLRKGFSYDVSSLGEGVQAVLDASPMVIVKQGERQPVHGYAEELNTQVQSLFTGSSAGDVAANLDSWWDSQR